MKKIKSVVAIVLVVAMLFSFAACGNKFAAVQKAFEAEGYTLDDTGITALFNGIVKEANKSTTEEGKEPTVKAHMFKTGLLKMGLVLEFKNSKDLQKFYDESSNTIKGIIKDAKESDFINGNCMLISVFSDMYEIFKKA